MRKRRIAAAAMVVGIMAALGLVATPAYAQSCYVVCDGANPNDVGYFDANEVWHRCTDGRTIYTLDPPGAGYVELRYSANCRMAWARGGIQAIWVQGFNANASFRVSYDHYNNDIGYTQAVNDAGLTARACIDIPSGGGVVCTPRY